jgi:hypothetical protein
MLKWSLPGLTPQVGFTRLAAHNAAHSGKPELLVQPIIFRKKMDARVEPGHDGLNCEYIR